MNFLICNQRHFCNSKTSILDIKWHFWAHFKHQFFRLFSAFSNVADDTFMGLICLIFWMWLFKLLKRTKVESDTRIVELVTAYSRKFSESWWRNKRCRLRQVHHHFPTIPFHMQIPFLGSDNVSIRVESRAFNNEGLPVLLFT